MFQAAKPNWMRFQEEAERAGPRPYAYNGGPLPAPVFQRENPQQRRRQEPTSEIYTVEVTNPDGSVDELDIEGPAGMSDSDLERLMGGQQGGQQQNIYSDNYLPDWVRENAPVTSVGVEQMLHQGAGFLQGAAEVGDNAAELAQGAYNQSLGRVFGQSDSAMRANEGGGFEGLANQLPQGGNVGNTAGQIGASALLTRRLPGALAQGAGSGALMSDAEDGWGLARDTLIGGAAGYAADRLVRGVAGMVNPQINPSVRELHRRGVRMSPGQAIPPFRRGEERLMSRPFVGDQIVRQRQGGFEDFQRAALDEVVAPYNAVSPRPVTVPQQPGRSAIRSVGDQLSDRYETLIPNLRMAPDEKLAADVQAVAANLTNGNLSPQAARQFATIVQNQIVPHLSGRTVSGEAYRQIERRLGNQIRRFSRSQEPDNQAMAEAFEQMQDAFQGALARSNPRYAQELAALNTSWRNLVRVEGAASGARGGLFSPAQFRQAVRRGDMSTRQRGMARGEAPMQRLADAADEILPNQYPDSGTAGRMQMNPFDPRYWIGAAQGLGYSPGVQQGIVNAAMGPRPYFAPQVADALRALPAPQAGAYGAGAMVSPFFGGIPY